MGASPPQRAADPTVVIDPVAVAGRLRYSAFRLARLLRQQDDSGRTPALLTALAVVDREGPLTLGELAAQEQVSPPTITKVVDTLESRTASSSASRDESDRRVCRVRVDVPAGAVNSDEPHAGAPRGSQPAARARPDELARLAAALDVLEQLTKPPGGSRRERARSAASPTRRSGRCGTATSACSSAAS